MSIINARRKLESISAVLSRELESVEQSLDHAQRELDQAQGCTMQWRPIRGNQPELPHSPEETVIFYSNPNMDTCLACDLSKVGASHWMPLPPRPRG